MIRLGINARSFVDPKLRGFNRHTLSLLEGFKRIGAPLEVHLFSDHKIDSSISSLFPSNQIHVSKVKPHLAWEQVSLPVEVRRRNMSIFHSTTNWGVPGWSLSGVPYVVTVHDLISIRQVRGWTGDFRADIKAKLSTGISWKAARKANAIITVSHYSAEQIAKEYPELSTKTHVIHNGVSSEFTPGVAQQSTLRKFDLVLPFFLFVGGFEPRKNLPVLLDAFLEFEAASHGKAQLALVGDSGRASKAIREKAEKSKGIRWLGYVSDNDLIDLYRAARAVVVPSLEEGFGFQVIEAMACGAPVFSSNSTSLPEVGGNVAVYFDPEKPSEIAQLMERAMRPGESDTWLKTLSEQGLKRAAQFTWKKAAEATVNLYESLV